MVLDIDATLVACHSEKEQAAATYKRGFGYHPLLLALSRFPYTIGKGMPNMSAICWTVFSRSPYSRWASAAWSTVSFGRRPPTRPRARAEASLALVFGHDQLALELGKHGQHPECRATLHRGGVDALPDAATGLNVPHSFLNSSPTLSVTVNTRACVTSSAGELGVHGCSPEALDQFTSSRKSIPLPSPHEFRRPGSRIV
ncbi:hypothetical protein ACFU8W_31370 [Streptomyces sp. NPDC057565]|uniref:hypothetical protein n=1 Tax=Streptomyces sp. NPDC057565 TaxID=3346169 RepID=UPI00368AA867